MKEQIEEFLSELESSGRSPVTVGHYRAQLSRFWRWLERTAAPDESEVDDDALRLEACEVTVAIRFRRTSSRYFQAAVALAKDLPGYSLSESGTHKVHAERVLSDPALWERVKRLAELVRQPSVSAQDLGFDKAPGLVKDALDSVGLNAEIVPVPNDG